MQEGDLVKMLNEIVIIFRELTVTKNISLIFNAPDQPVISRFDPSLLEKVFFNLLSNAVKNTPENGIIEVAVRIQAPTSSDSLTPSETITVSVADTGVGIPSNDLEWIFEPFFQVNEQNNSEVQGTGIGLSLAKGIVELHHGTISAESELGKGACFRVVLPYTGGSAEVPVHIPDVLNVHKNIEQSAIGRDVRVPDARKPGVALLIVDDNADIRAYIRKHLENEFNIHEAADGAIALQMAQELLYDLIISDVVMPAMNGLELCRQLKTTPATEHIPVILLSARTSILQIKEGLEFGADDYITKPFEADLLKARIHSIIANRKRLKEAFIKSFNVSLPDVSFNNLDEKFMNRAYDFVKRNIDNSELSIEQFGEQMHLSRTQLYRKIKALTGMSPSMFVSTLRLKVAAELLTDTSLSVSEIAYKVGFNTPSYFTTSFRRLYGVAPTDYVALKS
jgi:DNA-binding response OmpR family regulator